MFGENRVLSLQSHVVHGYVGNKAATFPLQLLGFDVDPLNSVNLSNHTGYRAVKGIVLEKKDIDVLFSGLQENGLLGMYSHVLTGYIGSVTFLEKITEIVAGLRALQARRTISASDSDGKATDNSRGTIALSSASPPVYVCDPVLGDEGRFYVSPDLIPIYRAKILPLATILTPNQFEAEVLTEVKIKDIPSACESMHKLHEMGVRTVIITSSSLTGADLLRSSCCESSSAHAGLPCEGRSNDGNSTATDASCAENTMLLLASCPISDVEDQITDPEGIFHDLCQIPEVERPAYVQFAIAVPKILNENGDLITFTGTGDMTAALLLAQSAKHPKNLVKATELVLRTVRAVCMRTTDAYNEHLRKLEIARQAIARDIAHQNVSTGAELSSQVNHAHGTGHGESMDLTEAKFYIECARGIKSRLDVYGSQSPEVFSHIETHKGDVEALANNTSPIPSFLELKLVQSKTVIESPPDFGFHAVRIRCVSTRT